MVKFMKSEFLIFTFSDINKATSTKAKATRPSKPKPRIVQGQGI